MKARSVERTMFYGAKPIIFERAKELRENMTPAEKKLWEHINSKKLGVRFKAQHPIENFIADFYSHKAKLVIEVDGEIHNEQKEYDEGRSAEMEKWELKVIRFTNKKIEENIEKVIEEIKTCIAASITPKSPEGDLHPR